MEAELESYQFQLSQVSSALEDDPSNGELASLKTELEEIISLTQEALGMTGGASGGVAEAGSAGQQGASGSGAKGKGKESGHGAVGGGKGKAMRAGDDCSAKYKDGKWYPARITAVTGSSDSPSYTVIFQGYSAPTTLPSSAVRPISAHATTSTASNPYATTLDDESDPEAPPPPPTSTAAITSAPPTSSTTSSQPATTSSTGKRKLTHAEEEREKEKKKKKLEKYKEGQKAKVQETIEKRTAWQAFGKKAAKKGHKIGGLEGKSIFRTPDNPMGKVGVVGSGQGVTSYEQRGKHVFNQGEGSGSK